MEDKTMICAECRTEIGECYYKCLDNFIQVKYFDKQDEVDELKKNQEDICYCKDCEIRNKDGYCMRQMTLNLITMVKDTDYCSWGERGKK